MATQKITTDLHIRQALLGQELAVADTPGLRLLGYPSGVKSWMYRYRVRIGFGWQSGHDGRAFEDAAANDGLGGIPRGLTQRGQQAMPGKEKPDMDRSLGRIYATKPSRRCAVRGL